jgi:hypothetical protein
MPEMNQHVPLVLVGILVAFSVLRAALPRRARVQRHADGAFEVQRPLSRRLLEIAGLGFWTVIVLIFLVASWSAEFTLGILVGGAAVVMLLWRAVDRLRRSSVLINRSEDEVRDGEYRAGRTSDVRAVVLQPHQRQPVALVFRESGRPERHWMVPGTDPKTAKVVGRELADYLRVPLEETP